MKTSLRSRIKERVARTGIGPFRGIVDVASAYLKFGDWLKRYGGGRKFASRHELYDFIRRDHIGPGPIDYLEFGVHRGHSLRHWVERDRDPESRFFGFDSFRGLPEDWVQFSRVVRKKEEFDVGGELPDIDDPRLTFVTGFFQDSLPPFLEGFAPRNRLVIHCDADLYSSTIFVLFNLDKYIKKGTIIIFDEFSSLGHEFEALLDYARSFGKEYEVIGHCEPFYSQLAIEIL